MAARNSGPDTVAAAPDPSGGKSTEQVGADNRGAARPVDVADQGNSAPASDSPSARLARDDADKTQDRIANETNKAARTAPQEMRLVTGAEPSAPTPGLDETIPGGLTRRADGSWQNAHGLDVTPTGEILDTQRNRESDPRRFSGIPR